LSVRDYIPAQRNEDRPGDDETTEWQEPNGKSRMAREDEDIARPLRGARMFL
jgi:hypothetical protein